MTFGAALVISVNNTSSQLSRDKGIFTSLHPSNKTLKDFEASNPIPRG